MFEIADSVVSLSESIGALLDTCIYRYRLDSRIGCEVLCKALPATYYQVSAITHRRGEHHPSNWAWR